MHTAVKIAPHYSAPVVYVPDASRAVGVVGSLLSAELRRPFLAELAREYEAVRVRHAKRQERDRLLPLEEARCNRFQADWANYRPPEPCKPGICVFDDYPLEVLTRYIDWSPFFQAWQLVGSYPKILDDEIVG